MRKTTFLWLCLAVICGVVLFHTSQEVNDGRTRLSKIERATQQEEESVRVLQAEWSYLNQPERLEKLSRQYLDLKPMHGRQFTKTADLPVRGSDTDVVETTKPVVTPPVATPIVKIQTPAVPPAKVPAKIVQPKPRIPAPKSVTREPAPNTEKPKRDFGSLLQSLGVQ